MTRRTALRLGGALLALGLFAAACGSDDTEEGGAPGDTEPAGTTEDAQPEPTVQLTHDDLLAEVTSRGNLNCGVSGSILAMHLSQVQEAHVVGETLVQPDAAPVVDRHGIAEPLVSELVGDDHSFDDEPENAPAGPAQTDSGPGGTTKRRSWRRSRSR